MYHLIFVVKIKIIMKVSILGDGLTSLTLAKSLVNQGVNVDIFSERKTKKINKIQTIGISKANIDFFNKNILNINKFLWKIYKMIKKVFSNNKSISFFFIILNPVKM